MSPSRIQTRGVKLQPPLYEKIDNVPPHLYPLAMKTEGYISGQHVVPLKIKERKPSDTAQSSRISHPSVANGPVRTARGATKNKRKHVI
jgi:hypothetical protein